MNESKVIEVITKLLNDSGDELVQDAEEQWDSLSHISILVELDSIFEGKCSSISELESAYKIDKILEILKNNNLIE